MRVVALDVGNRVGYAEWDGYLTELSTYGYYEQIMKLFTHLAAVADADTVFLIEEPRKGSKRARSRDLGRCEEKAKTLQAWITACGGNVTMVKPNRFTKLTPAQFKAYWPDQEGKTSSHSRDAGMMIWVWLRQRGVR